MNLRDEDYFSGNPSYLKKKKKKLFFGRTVYHVGIFAPQLGLNLQPSWRKHAVLTTGQPGEFLTFFNKKDPALLSKMPL